MPRRKQTTIKLEELDIYPALLEELRSHPTYSDKDFAALKLTVLESYEATIKEVDKAIIHLQHYVAAKKNAIETFEDEQFINRTQLSKMLGLSRQTLTSWISKGFITPLKSKNLPDIETFNTDAVMKQLRQYKTNHPGKQI
jgi:DNA-binding XRE family transcriptional regulator